MKNNRMIFLLLGMVLFGALDAMAAQSFTDNGNGTITDNVTGMMWQAQDSGHLVADLKNWATALTYCEELTLGGNSDWRLPNVKELVSIVDYYTVTDPTINLDYFPSTLNWHYWSSTTYAHSTTNAWYVDFHFGVASADSKGTGYPVRCVRLGQ